jgi:sulfatase maturation enzyme AslB (radical SAM superfamily)
MSYFKQVWSTLSGTKNSNEELEAAFKEYNLHRSLPEQSLLCRAPFSNLYFNTEGHVALCWQTFHRYEKYTEQKTLKEIWNGLNFERIRHGIKKLDLDYGCSACKNHLLEKNFTNILARAYDNDYPETGYPSIIEFELSNTCNLGCTMCNGMLSSTIRKDRENLPPLESPYGEKFLTELREFIPYLKEARFNGGEPFLIKIYGQIWDMMAEINPGIKIIIATNGTVLNSKVKEYMQRGNFHFNISIDGITANSYESIRLNGNFNKLMENFIYFKEYCKTNRRKLCIMINPMRQNWQDMPGFVDFANEHDVDIWFNTITKPAEQALWSLPAHKLKEIYDSLSSFSPQPAPDTQPGTFDYNTRTYRNLVEQQIKTWWLQAQQAQNENELLVIGEDEPVKAVALKKVFAYLINREEDRSLVANKIAELDSMVDSALKDLFYKSILDSNPETIVTLCKQQTIPELFELFKARLKESN